MSKQQQTEPRAGRARMPKTYGVPESEEGTLPWSWAVERLESTINYWVGTTRPDGRPHAVPVWGVWLDGDFYFEGGRDTQRGSNLAANPAVAVHIERGDDIVILEGTAAEIVGPDEPLASRLVDAFAAKYEPKYGYRPSAEHWREGELYVVRRAVVLGWHEFPSTATRWRF